MLRAIIKTITDNCIGCGICANICPNGALSIISKQVSLSDESACNACAKCIGKCPMAALEIENRECSELDISKDNSTAHKCASEGKIKKLSVNGKDPTKISMLNQWPVKLKQLLPNISFLDGCDLLIAGDCTAYAYANFHREFIENKTVIIFCPKLDDTEYEQKLYSLFVNNKISSITVVRMETPCCALLPIAVTDAMRKLEYDIPYFEYTITLDGFILTERKF